MPRMLRQRRAQHWLDFLAAMAVRHETVPSSKHKPTSDAWAPPDPVGVSAPQQLDRSTALPPQSVIDAFGDHILRAAHQRNNVPTWWRARAHRRFGGKCAYCNRHIPLSRPLCLDHVIPPAVGGPCHIDAAVLCCRGCKRAKAGRDLLLWRRELSPSLCALRHQLAQEGQNHPISTPDNRRASREVALRMRWCLPRFGCHLMTANNGCLIGWARLMDAPMGAYVTLLCDHAAHTCLTSDQTSPSPMMFWMPKSDDAQTWGIELVEQNAWIQPWLSANHMSTAVSAPAWLSYPPSAWPRSVGIAHRQDA